MSERINSEKPIDDARYKGVFVYKRDLIYLRGSLNSLESRQEDHAFILRWFNGNWGQYVINSAVASHCVISDPERKVLSLTPFGHVHTAAPDGFGWEELDPGQNGPNSLRHMIDIKPIHGFVYAVGMARMVYKRTGPDTWRSYNHGMKERANDFSISGFRSIDGSEDGSLYAVGLRGEIWYFNGSEWCQLDSPTNLKFERVVCVSNDCIYVCGAAGILLCGNKNGWRVISNDLTKRTFWGMSYYNGALYLADNANVYSCDGNRLEKVDMRLQATVSTSYLHSNDGILASVGEKDIVLYDGQYWTKLSPPSPA